jgi:hypothetical protein
MGVEAPHCLGIVGELRERARAVSFLGFRPKWEGEPLAHNGLAL